MTITKYLKVAAIFSILLVSFPITTYAAQWKGYVCKVTDYLQCKKGQKRIFPRPERYDDKDTCYREFRKIYETDPEMNRLYPQTSNPRESYIFGCVKD